MNSVKVFKHVVSLLKKVVNSQWSIYTEPGCLT